MVEIRYSGEFKKSVEALPKEIQRKITTLIPFFSLSPFHPKLHTKALAGPFDGKYSFRITRDWRVVFIFLDRDAVFLIDAAHRRDIYK